MGICQGYSAVVGEVLYVCILKKNVCVGSKFEDISLTKVILTVTEIDGKHSDIPLVAPKS